MNIKFVQDNHSKSSYAVLRGLHYQRSPFSQGKLVRVIRGEVFDVAVDIRKNSDTKGKWVSYVISEKNKRQIWIPEGFAHGFVVLSEFAELCYKTTNYYNPNFEECLLYNDPKINITWPILREKFKINKKDLNGKNFESEHY
jgi:dTDP-4-dehydrorhamnose 3,5-epimerase